MASSFTGLSAAFLTFEASEPTGNSILGILPVSRLWIQLFLGRLIFKLASYLQNQISNVISPRMVLLDQNLPDKPDIALENIELPKIDSPFVPKSVFNRATLLILNATHRVDLRPILPKLLVPPDKKVRSSTIKSKCSVSLILSVLAIRWKKI